MVYTFDILQYSYFVKDYGLDLRFLYIVNDRRNFRISFNYSVLQKFGYMWLGLSSFSCKKSIRTTFMLQKVSQKVFSSNHRFNLSRLYYKNKI